MDKSVSESDRLLEEARSLLSDSPAWSDLLKRLWRLGWVPELEGDRAQFHDGGWIVRGAAGWVSFNSSTSFREALIFVRAK